MENGPNMDLSGPLNSSDVVIFTNRVKQQRTTTMRERAMFNLWESCSICREILSKSDITNSFNFSQYFLCYFDKGLRTFDSSSELYALASNSVPMFTNSSAIYAFCILLCKAV